MDIELTTFAEYNFECCICLEKFEINNNNERDRNSYTNNTNNTNILDTLDTLNTLDTSNTLNTLDTLNNQIQNDDEILLFDISKLIKTTCCNQYIHKNCLLKWIISKKNNDHCPLCRKTINIPEYYSIEILLKTLSSSNKTEQYNISNILLKWYKLNDIFIKLNDPNNQNSHIIININPHSNLENSNINIQNDHMPDHITNENREIKIACMLFIIPVFIFIILYLIFIK